MACLTKVLKTTPCDSRKPQITSFHSVHKATTSDLVWLQHLALLLWRKAKRNIIHFVLTGLGIQWSGHNTVEYVENATQNSSTSNQHLDVPCKVLVAAQWSFFCQRLRPRSTGLFSNYITNLWNSFTEVEKYFKSISGEHPVTRSLTPSYSQ